MNGIGLTPNITNLKENNHGFMPQLRQRLALSARFPYEGPVQVVSWQCPSGITVMLGRKEPTMTTTIRQCAIGFAKQLGGALLISLNLRWLAQARRKLRKRRTAA